MGAVNDNEFKGRAPLIWLGVIFADRLALNPEHTIHELTRNLTKRHEPMLTLDVLSDQALSHIEFVRNQNGLLRFPSKLTVNQLAKPTRYR